MFAALAEGVEFVAKLKSPSPFVEFGTCRTGEAWGCLELNEVLVAGFVPVSKKPPPPVALGGGGEFIGGEVIDERWGAGLVKLANGSVLGCGCVWADGGEVEDEKLRPLNASSRPPKLDDCCAGGDCRPPKPS